jgi:Uncharacterized protein conserved in bacteria
MSDTFSFGELEVEATLEEQPGLAEPETPFRIALMGDWSGRANRRPPAQSIAERKPLLIDRDNFDEVMAGLNIILRLPVTDDGPHLTLSFRELEDFHPDRIFERVGLFDALRETRERLDDSDTFAEAARQVRGWANATESQETRTPSAEQKGAIASETSAPVDGGSLLEQMLAETDDAPLAKPAAADDDLQAMLREVVRPHLVSFDEAEQEQLVASVDEATSRLMRSILHHADFQSLEAAWRAAYFLISNLETGTDLKLYLLDVTKDELASDLNATDKLEETGAYRLLAEQSVNTFGGDLWATIAGNYTFEATRADALMLGRLAKIAERTGAPFIAAAASNLVGCKSLAQTPDPDDWQQQLDPQVADAWNALRGLEQASYLGLALPRFLLRLPYGAATEPTETFDFEEMSGEPEHESYLWANPSFACAYLLAQSFTEFGWNLQPGILQEIEGLPLHIYQHDGDSYIKPCAETILTMRAAEKILAQSLMPLISFQGRDTIRLARFQSLAAEASTLSGRWS